MVASKLNEIVIGLEIAKGEALMASTPTRVKFAMFSDAYFDGPGSTFMFSIVEINGEFHLHKVAHAFESGSAVSVGGVGPEWSKGLGVNKQKAQS